ncbi:ankyrin [Elysia marginata]|uniref:Ankyrin n=1 Tax=Elysia marginata TaxID=1093978 RepID=A0AAV4K025_9GAST|nr:ankyrin [Elysia marginata]
MGKTSELIRAIRSQDRREVDHLLASRECSINGDGSSRDPPLIECINSGFKREDADKRCKILKKLVLYGADVNIQASGRHGKTAVMLASARGFLDCVETLGTCGADVNIRSCDGDTALSLAVESEHLDIVEYLTQRMRVSALDFRNQDGKTSLSLAAAGDIRFSVRCLQHLIEAGAGLDARNEDGSTALMVAIEERNFPAVKVLLNNGANANTLTGTGKSPLTLALRNHYYSYPTIIKLLQCGGDPAQTRRDQVHLHSMVTKSIAVLVRALVKNGFPPLDVQCNRLLKSKVSSAYRDSLPPLSPLAIALLCGKLDMARYFIANKFFTTFDVARLCGNPLIRRILKRARSARDSRSRQSLEILDLLSVTPHSLFILCKVAVTSALTLDIAKEIPNHRTQQSNKAWDCGPSFRARVGVLGLPRPLQRELLHETPASGMCLRTWPYISIERKTLSESCSCSLCEGEKSDEEDSE